MMHRQFSSFSSLLPSWEKADAAQRRTDEGAYQATGIWKFEAPPHPALRAALSHEGRGA
jgi:hypothetical protein